ncbi:MAG: hypothetical protein H0X65_00035 [Gemmatimonadetes bacterium]|nr:hypothetical protein [Gemmatimonadota bacterium]
MKRLIHGLPVLTLAAFAISCADGSQLLSPEGAQISKGASTGTLEVSTATTGSNLPSGYTLKVSGQPDRQIGVNATQSFNNLPTGSYSVELSGMRSHCTVSGENPRSINNGPGKTRTSFSVSCAAETGTLQVSTATTGSNLPSGYTLKVSGQPDRQIGANATESFNSLPNGSYTVELSGVPAHCTVSGENPRSLNNGPGTTTSFSISCAAETGTLEVSTTTTGSNLPSGYTLKVSGQPDRQIGASATQSYSDLPTGSYSVELAGMPTHCTVSGENPRTVSVGSGTNSISFSISCAAEPDTQVRAAELVVRPTSTSQLGTFVKSSKPIWWHDGHWWIMSHGWRAFRRDASGVWTEASNTLMGSNSRRLDVHVQSNGDIIFYGKHGTDSRIGTARYDSQTKTYTSTANVSAPAGNSAGSSAWGTMAVDSHGRVWVNYGLSGINQYAVYDPATGSQLLGATALDQNIWTTEHLARIVAFRDAEGAKIGVLLDDQVSGEMRFWVRRDSDPLDSGWRREIVDRRSAGADDHGDVVVTPNGEVLAVWKTSHKGSSDPILRYARRTANGTWVDLAVVRTRYGSSSSNEFTRPRIQYDRDTDHVYVVATTLDTREVHVMRSTRLNPDFGAYNAPAVGKAWPAPYVVLDTGGQPMLNPATSATMVDGQSGYFFAVVGQDDNRVWGLHLSR